MVLISHNKFQVNTILENKFIESLAHGFQHAPLQQNRLHESDAELVNIPGTDRIIALTTDGIVEEIEKGLYTDPYLIGWMTVIVNVSDLAATGAEQIGILLNETLPPETGDDYLARLQQGINDACSESNIYVLGGDTNFSSSMQMSGCALGYFPNGDPLTRMGCRPGELLYSSGRLGQGSSYAFLKYSGRNELTLDHYKPKPHLREGQILRKYASCCMDTSDGFFPTVDQLMRLNKFGFRLETPMVDFVHPQALDLSRRMQIPLWMMLAGPHGEFKLVFTIPENKKDDFLKSAAVINWEPCLVGRVTDHKIITLLDKNKYVTIDTGRIRNLFNEVNGDMQKYIKELFSLNY